ncbi:MAG: nicotinamide-nucleotide amidohydrolase family protein [Spirochaetaceae bacterium]|nr:nicotinamide-nucleotide amidohydrolase family protein [Spirochaetaceae bacterium]
MASIEAQELIRSLSSASLSLVLAESCTAGLAADLIARIPGASQVFWGSFVCYSIDAKQRMLGVDQEFILRYGAVSGETACAMAEGALARSGADLAAAVTGLAGPDGDGSSIPVGTVWIGVAGRERQSRSSVFHYSGSRNEIRLAAALDTLRELIRNIPHG